MNCVVCIAKRVVRGDARSYMTYNLVTALIMLINCLSFLSLSLYIYSEMSSIGTKKIC